MRYTTFQLIPEDGDLHPFGAYVRDDPDLTRRAIHHFNVLDDEQMIILVEFEGDVEKLRRIVDEHPDVISSSVSESDGGIYVYAHFRVDDWMKRLYTVSKSHEIFIDMPMYYTDRGALVITSIGELADLREATFALPSGVRVDLLSTGEYSPDGSGAYDQLTERQKETLRTAVEIGYYEEPRRVTYQDVADELGVAAGTVGEHLRKIESTILKRALPGYAESSTVPQ